MSVISTQSRVTLDIQMIRIKNRSVAVIYRSGYGSKGKDMQRTGDGEEPVNRHIEQFKQCIWEGSKQTSETAPGTFVHAQQHCS